MLQALIGSSRCLPRLVVVRGNGLMRHRILRHRKVVQLRPEMHHARHERSPVVRERRAGHKITRAVQMSERSPCSSVIPAHESCVRM